MEKETRKVTTRIVTNYSPSDDAITEIVHCGNVTEIKVLERNPLNNLGKCKRNPNDTKCIVKGARLRFYPHNKRFYSYSKGIKKPLTIRTTYGEAKKNYDLEDCVYKKAQEIVLKPDDESEKEKVVNRVLRLQLNSKRKKKS